MLWTRFVVGYHGCDADLARQIVCKETVLAPSQNDYDWLGNGIYFWEGSPERAMQWAQNAAGSSQSSVKKPGVIGAVIDLGECLNLIEAEYLRIVNQSYLRLVDFAEIGNIDLPKNSDGGLRKLDCAVFEALHASREENGMVAFDTVRAFFVEGPPLYPGAGVRQQDHIQICIRNLDKIVGCFLP